MNASMINKAGYEGISYASAPISAFGNPETKWSGFGIDYDTGSDGSLEGEVNR